MILSRYIDLNKYKDDILSLNILLPNVLLMLQQITLGTNIFSHDFSKLINFIFLGFFTCISFIYIIKNKINYFLLLYAIFIFIIIVSYFIYPNNNKYLIEGLPYILFINVPLALSFSAITDIEILKKNLNFTSNIIFVFSILYSLLIFFQKISFLSYNMSFSYYLLLPGLTYIYNDKIINRFKFILIFAFILFLGSRGALFILIIFYIYTHKLFLSFKFYFYSFLIYIIYLSVDLNYFLILFLQKFSFLPRSLLLLTNNNRGLFHYDDRALLQNKIFKEILINPFSGRGIFSDRYILRNYGIETQYTHNILLELLLNFGFLIGSLIILYLFFLIIHVYKTINASIKNVFLLFIFSSGLPLFFSGSYLTSSWFGILIGSLLFFKSQKKLFN